MAKADAVRDIELMAYDIGGAAAALGIDTDRMSGLIRAGVVPHITLGTRRLVGKQALEQWLTAACLANAQRALSAAPPSPPSPLRPPKRTGPMKQSGRAPGARRDAVA